MIFLNPYYFEESTGFMYEQKQFGGGIYYSPLNFYTINEKIQQVPTDTSIREQEKLYNRCKRTARHNHKAKTLGRNKVQNDKRIVGRSRVHIKKLPKRNCVHRVFGTSSTVGVSKIRLRKKADYQKRKEGFLEMIAFYQNQKPVL